MAITKIWPVKDNLSRVYRYISNEEKTTEEISDGLNEVLTYTTQGYKTNEKEYITGINCSPASAVKQMIHTKKSYGKDDEERRKYRSQSCDDASSYSSQAIADEDGYVDREDTRRRLGYGKQVYKIFFGYPSALRNDFVFD